MTGRETIDKIIKDQNKTVAEFAKSCGLTTAAMWERLYGPKQKDIPLSTFNDMLRVLGYKILVVPFSARATNGSYYVDCVMTPETAAKVKEKLERKSQKSSPAKKANATDQPVEQPTNAPNELASAPAIEPASTEPTEADYKAVYSHLFRKDMADYEYYDESADATVNEYFLWNGYDLEAQKKRLDELARMDDEKRNAEIKQMSDLLSKHKKRMWELMKMKPVHHYWDDELDDEMPF